VQSATGTAYAGQDVAARAPASPQEDRGTAKSRLVAAGEVATLNSLAVLKLALHSRKNGCKAGGDTR
jgi:hypothetical protein